MSYNPSENYPNSDLRNPSGIVFFGKNPSKPMLDSSSTFLVDEDNSQLKVPNILLSDGDIGVAGNTNAINIASNLVTFATGVQIEGDLVVNGTTVTVNTETVTIDDNILVLNNNWFASGAAIEDAGIEIERGSDNNVRFIWDEGSNYWSISDDNGVSYELATRSGVQEFLNKTIDGDKNTFLNIPITALDAYAVTVNAGTGLAGGGTVNLGNSITINLGAGNGLTPSADSVSVTPGTGIVVNSQGVHVGSGVIAQQPFLAATGVLPNNDTLLILDSGVGLKQITVNDLIAGADLLTEFSVSGANTTNVSLLSEGERLVFASGVGANAGVIPVVSSDGGGNPVVTLNVDEGLIYGRQEANFNENDLLLFYDSDGAGLRTVTQQQLISDLASSISGVTGSGEDPGIMSFWALWDGKSGDDHVSLVYNLTTLTMQGVSGVDVDVAGPYDQVKIGLEPTSVSAGAYGSPSSVASFIVDANGRLTYAANSGIQITASQVSDFDTEAQDAVFLNANFLDTATIDFTVNETTHAVSGKVIDGSITEAHINSSALLSTGGLQGGSSTKISVRAGDAITVNTTGVSVTDDGITNAKLRNSSALSVIGRSANSIGDPADIVAGTDHYVLRRSGSSLGFGLIGTNNISDDAITEAKLFRAIQTTSSTVTATGDIILAEGGTGGITINLPAITSNEGRIITIKKTDAAAGQIIIDGNSTETIDGAETKRLYYQYETMTLVCDASAGWYII